MIEFIKRFFRAESSSNTARERLRLVLLSDHLALAPEVVDALKADLLAMLAKYVEVDESNLDVTFEQREREVAFLANIPIKSMKPRPPQPPARVSPVAVPVASPALDPAPALAATLDPIAPMAEEATPVALSDADHASVQTDAGSEGPATAQGSALADASSPIVVTSVDVPVLLAATNPGESGESADTAAPLEASVSVDAVAPTDPAQPPAGTSRRRRRRRALPRIAPANG